MAALTVGDVWRIAVDMIDADDDVYLFEICHYGRHDEGVHTGDIFDGYVIFSSHAS